MRGGTVFGAVKVVKRNQEFEAGKSGRIPTLFGGLREEISSANKNAYNGFTGVFASIPVNAVTNWR